MLSSILNPDVARCRPKLEPKQFILHIFLSSYIFCGWSLQHPRLLFFMQRQYPISYFQKMIVNRSVCRSRIILDNLNLVGEIQETLRTDRWQNQQRMRSINRANWSIAKTILSNAFRTEKQDFRCVRNSHNIRYNPLWHKWITRVATREA